MPGCAVSTRVGALCRVAAIVQGGCQGLDATKIQARGTVPDGTVVGMWAPARERTCTKVVALSLTTTSDTSSGRATQCSRSSTWACCWGVAQQVALGRRTPPLQTEQAACAVAEGTALANPTTHTLPGNPGPLV